MGKGLETKPDEERGGYDYPEEVVLRKIIIFKYLKGCNIDDMEDKFAGREGII